MKTLKNKEVQTLSGWAIVKKDFRNGELLFNNNILGREEDILRIKENGVIKKFVFYDLALQVALEYYQAHQPIKDEFNDLLNSDKDFNYSENEFTEWIKDCVLQL
jgi:hypothetical protein